MYIVDSAEFLLPGQNDNGQLREAYEAYQVFCENGSHRIAWRNLALALTTYLKSYFVEAPNGTLRVSLGLHPRPARVEYLINIDVAQLGYLVQDALWVLFRHTTLIADDFEQYDYDRMRILPREYLSKLALYDLQILLVDITNELNRRAPLSTYHHGMSIADLPSDWNPTAGTDLGIVHHVDVQLAPEDAATLLQFTVIEDLEVKPTLYALPRILLRRALSLGSRVQSKRHPSGRRAGGEHDIFRDLDPARVPRAYTERLRKVDKPPQPAPSEPKATTRALEIIPEENEEFQWPWTEDETDVVSSWSDADSIESSQTIDSLLDFYDQYFEPQNASAKTIYDPSKRASVDVGEISRPEFQDRLVLARGLFDDKASVASFGSKSIRSALSGHQSFITARTRISDRTGGRISKKTSIDSFVSLQTTSSLTGDLVMRSAYWGMLKERDLLPHPTVETDWSGRGQHAEFNPEERDQIPLLVEKVLGHTRMALVESVRCRRVRLVRKLMRCTKWSGLKREDALREVQHLYRIRHSHIVRLVGTYVIGSDLAILTYPCAEWNLEQFMELTRAADDATKQCASLSQFFTCLAKVLDFMHSFPLKHMDIKPQNLLVRSIQHSQVNDADPFKIYFTDFGISRSYESVEESETENPTSFTRAYAPLEVVLQETRGLSSDVFSLGCVFTEMIATIMHASHASTPGQTSQLQETSNHWDSLIAVRQSTEGGLRPYHRTNENVCSWLSGLAIHEPELRAVRNWTVEMLNSDPKKRPTARQVADDPHLSFACLSCTLRTGPEDFEAAEPLTPLQDSPHTNRVSIEVPNPP